jgi:hypothetical protein
MLILLILGLACSKESNVIVVTPSTSLDARISMIDGYEDVLSPIGVRQSYLIGRHLRQKYFKDDGTYEFIFEALTNSSLGHAQTALNINQGLFIAGTGEVVEHKLIDKSKPVIKDAKFDEYEKLIRNLFASINTKGWFRNSL